MAAGDLSGAGEAFDRALQARADDAGLWVDIARLRYRGGEHLQAIEAVERALSLDGEHAGALLFKGQIARDAEGLAAGSRWFARGLELHPDDPALLGEQAATLIDLDRASEGLAMVRRLAEIAPGSPDIYFLQAVVAARAGDFPLARRLLQRLPDGRAATPASLLLDGVIALEQGRFASAAQSLDGLVERQPDNRRARDLLARALLLDGRYRQLIARFAEPKSCLSPMT